MKKTLKTSLIVMFALALLQMFGMASKTENITVAAEEFTIKPVKYVFLFIGDGMSVPQRMAAEEFSLKTSGQKLFINSMPQQAITTTGSANAYITDSAASGTAIACGEKTKNGTIGMDATLKRNVYSIAHVAQNAGKKVGIISSVPINNATPATFYGHRPSRSQGYELGLDLVASNFDYFAGGRITAHNDTKNPSYQGDIYDLARKAGYAVSIDDKKLPSFDENTKKILHTSDLSSLPYAIDNADGKYLRLENMVRHAISFLDNEKGFFIMAEGGKIDWVGHSNDAATNMREVIDFDNAVKAAYEFAIKHPEETLIVITGDHETGGMTLGFAGTGYKSKIENLAFQKCSIDNLHAYLRKLAKDKDVVVFDDIKPILKKYLNLTFPGDPDAAKGLLLTDAEVAKLKDAFERKFPGGKYPKSSHALSIEAIRIFNSKCDLSWTTGGHTALPVLTTAYGVNAELFSNFIDNTDIAKKLKSVVSR